MPSVGTLRVYDPLLTGFSLAYKNQRDSFVAGELFPTFPTGGVETGSYYVHARGNLFAAPRMAHRADAAESHEVRWQFDRETFACEAFAYNTLNTPRQRTNVLPPMNIDREDAEFLTELLLIEKELRVKALIDALTADADLSGGSNTQWNEASAVPRYDIETGRLAIRRATGMDPNLMILPQAVYSNIRTNSTAGTAGAQIAAAIQYTMAATSGNINPSLLAQYFDVPRIRIASAVVAGNPYYKADMSSPTNTDIWGDTIVLAYVAPRPAVKSVTAGWTFSAKQTSTFTWTEARRANAKVIEVEEIVSEKIVSRSAIYVIKDVLA